MFESIQFVTVDPDNRVVTTLPAPAPLVELRGVSRSYGGVQAVAEMSFAIRSGTVHALVGENGAGKSTLVKILTGIVQPDEGEIAIEGAARRISDPQAAHGLGIVAMYQEPTVFEDLTRRRERLRRASHPHPPRHRRLGGDARRDGPHPR